MNTQSVSMGGKPDLSGIGSPASLGGPDNNIHIRSGNIPVRNSRCRLRSQHEAAGCFSPIMERKKKDLASAKGVQNKEQNKFMIDKKAQLAKCVQYNKKIVRAIPNSYVSQKLKREFLRMRE